MTRIENPVLFPSCWNYHLNNYKRHILLLLASSIDAHTSRISSDDNHLNKETRQRQMSRIDCSLFLLLLLLLHLVRCLIIVLCRAKEGYEAELCDSENEITNWLRASSSSLSLSLFFVTIVDGSAREDTRSLSLINNSVNEQIV